MQSNTWETEEINFILENLHLDTKDIWLKFSETLGNRTYNAVQKKVKQLRELHVDAVESTDPFASPPNPEHDFIVDFGEDLPVPTLLVSDEHLNVLQPDSSPQEVKEQTRQFIEALKDLSMGVDMSYRPGVVSDKASLVIVLSDLHFGKKTSYFNLQVAANRIMEIPGKIAELKSLPEIDEVVLVLAGDIVDGEDIYANQNGELECPVIEQAKVAAEAIWRCALNCKQTFKCKVRMETSPGNHGRMSKTASVVSNWDNVVYQMLGVVANTTKDPDISVNVNFDFFRTFEVKGKKGLSYHYGTKHLGTPAMQVKFAGWIINYGLDFIVHGHWHHWGVETYLGRPMVSNGSLPGGDDLAQRMAVEEPPRQAFFFVQRDKPLFGFSFVEW